MVIALVEDGGDCMAGSVWEESGVIYREFEFALSLIDDVSVCCQEEAFT